MKRFIFAITIFSLVFILIGCNKVEDKQVVNPFNDLPYGLFLDIDKYNVKSVTVH